MFWNGERWVDERAARPRQTRFPRASQRVTDLLATGIMVVAVVLLGIPLSGAFAGTPAVALSPSSGPVGTVVTVQGSNLGARTRVSLTWDGSIIGPGRMTGKDGSLATTVTIPSALAGGHTIGISTDPRGARGSKASAPATVLAAATFIVGVAAGPTAGPTAAADQTARPTAAATAASAPTADPTAPPTPQPPDPTAPPTPQPPDPTAPPTPRPPDPTPAPPPPGALTGMYGSAFAMDSKNNWQVGWLSNQLVSYRFRASTSSSLKSVAFVQRGGIGYSSGNGGRMQISVQADSNGHPSGTALASLTFSPGNPSGNWEDQGALAFADPAPLTRGDVYHIVFKNIDGSPTTNYISVNDSFQFLALSDREPAFTNDFAVMTKRNSDSWIVQPNDTPAVDLAYTNGFHDGNAYSSIVADYYSEISGVQMARERFTISGDTRVVSGAVVRVKRISGSSPLTVRLEESDGTVLGSDTAAASQIPLSPLPTPSTGNHWDEDSLAGGRWVAVDFGHQITLASGKTYRLRLSTSSDTLYAAIPIREQTNPMWYSRAFRDGDAQRTSNGTSWALVYQYGELDLQFYLR